MPKIVFAFLFLSSFIGSTFAQPEVHPPTINIQKTNISVGEVLKEITRQSGLHFSYNPQTIDTEQKISIKIVAATLEEALEILAAKIPIEYSLIDQQIVLNHKTPSQKENPPEREFYTISGFINDKSSGESLFGASVFVEGALQGTNTNAFGFYSLRLPKDDYPLAYSFIGFDTEKVDVHLVKDEKKDVALAYANLELPSVIVKTPLQDLLSRKQLGQMELTPEELENMPEFGGESGLVKGLQSLPGIKSHSDGSAFFFTRGGEKDQNLIIIDDAPIYNPAHLFGFYSIVVPDFTKSIRVYKSDVPVNLGDRLSSIIDIRTKDGNLHQWEFNGAFNPLVYRFSLEGPVVKGKSSLFLAFRRSNFAWIYKRNAPDAQLNFGDFNFKWNYKINNKNRFFFTIINARDNLLNGAAIANSGGITWGNFTSTLRWNHIFGPKLFSNTILYTGNYNYKLFYGANAWNSGIGNLSLKSDFTYYANPKLTAKFGLERQGFYFNPGKVQGESISSLFPNTQQGRSRQSALYFNAEYKWSEKWQFNAGWRLTTWENRGPADYYLFDEAYEVKDSISVGRETYQSYANIDPRLSVNYQVDNTTALKATYGIYHQYMQLISNSVSPFTSLEVWLPSSPNIRPQVAHQMTLSYLKYFEKQKMEFGLEGYYKNMDHQIDYEPHANTLLNPLIEGELRFGQMKSYGLEFLLKKNFGHLTGWMTYTYSRTLRNTPEINNGRTYPAFHDRPHDFSLMLNYEIARRILLSTYWTAYTGSAFSSPTGFYVFNDNVVPIYGEKNNARLPAYNRMDFAFKFILNKNPESRFQHSLTFSVYNALAHKNIVAVDFNKVVDKAGNPIVRADFIAERDLVVTQADLIRFLPSLTYKFGL